MNEMAELILRYEHTFPLGVYSIVSGNVSSATRLQLVPHRASSTSIIVYRLKFRLFNIEIFWCLSPRPISSDGAISRIANSDIISPKLLHRLLQQSIDTVSPILFAWNFRTSTLISFVVQKLI